MSRSLFRAQLLSLSLLTASAHAQSPASPSPAPVTSTASQLANNLPPLTLEECIARALNKNFDLQIQSFARESALQSLLIAEADFEPEFSFTTTRSTDQAPNTVDRLEGTTDEGRRTGRFNNSASISKRFLTGGTAEVGTSLNRSADSSSNALLNPLFTSDVVLSVRQPLLRGFGFAYNRANIDRARLGVTRAGFDFRSSVLAVIRNVETAYYNLGFAREQADVRRFSLQVAERLFSENQTRRTTGVSTDLEVLQAEVGVENARRNLLQAEQTVRDREDNLLALIGQFEFFTTTLGPVQFGTIPTPSVSFDQSYNLARQNAPDYASTKLSIEQLKLDAANAAANRKPIVDLIANGGYNAREGEAARAAEEVWSREGYDWQLGLQVTVPLGFKAERARYRIAMINVRREESRLQQIEQNLIVQVRAAVRAVETNLAAAQIAAKAVQLNVKQFDLEKARYEAGISTFRRVQESQEQLDTARVSELQARINLRFAIAELSRLEGSSLQTYNVQLEN